MSRTIMKNGVVINSEITIQGRNQSTDITESWKVNSVTQSFGLLEVWMDARLDKALILVD